MINKQKHYQFFIGLLFLIIFNITNSCNGSDSFSGNELPPMHREESVYHVLNDKSIEWERLQKEGRLIEYLKDKFGENWEEVINNERNKEPEEEVTEELTTDPIDPDRKDYSDELITDPVIIKEKEEVINPVNEGVETTNTTEGTTEVNNNEEQPVNVTEELLEETIDFTASLTDANIDINPQFQNLKPVIPNEDQTFSTNVKFNNVPQDRLTITNYDYVLHYVVNNGSNFEKIKTISYRDLPNVTDVSKNSGIITNSQNWTREKCEKIKLGFYVILEVVRYGDQTASKKSVHEIK